jgi:hypothetical protein
LSADQRLVIQNGAIRKVVATSDEEPRELLRLRQMDEVFSKIRNCLRRGESIVG